MNKTVVTELGEFGSLCRRDISPGAGFKTLPRAARPIANVSRESAMPEEVVKLPAEMKAFVEAELARGDYRDRNEVFLVALALLRMKREEASEKEAILRHEIGLALDQLDRGEVAAETSAQEVIERIRTGRR